MTFSSVHPLVVWLFGLVVGLILGWLFWRRPARQRIGELQARLGEREERLRANEQALGAAQQQNRTLEASLTAYYARLTEAYKRITELQNELVNLRSAHHELRARMETQIATAKAGKEVQEVELEELRTKAAELRAGLDIREAENADLRHRLEAAQTARAELENVLAHRDRELEALNRQVAALQAELEAAQINRRGLEATLSQRMTELAALQMQVESLQAQAAAMPTAPPPAVVPDATTTVALAEQAAAAPQAETPTVAEAEALTERAAAAPFVALDVAAIKARILRATPEAGVTVRQQAWPQDLEEVRGIGQAFANRLYRAGIGTFWELVHLNDAEWLAILQPAVAQRRRLDWDAIRQSALALAQTTDTVGLVWSGTRADDFVALPGLGKALARRLYEAGILTYEDLAQKTPEQLAAVFGVPPGGRFDYEAWIAEARRRVASAGDETENVRT
ncbi:MAG: helix-hairpin-helix domain-containing protein [Caldilineales bacterium]|nr:helix-hairpin-helix domain-containing protein [Caldilineales bacterium]